jgi:hypothetical protein
MKKGLSSGEEPWASYRRIMLEAIGDAIGAAEERVARGPLQWQSSARWLESIAPDVWRIRTEQGVNLRARLSGDPDAGDKALALALKRAKDKS